MAYMKDTAGIRLDTLNVSDVVTKVRHTKRALFSFGGTRATATTDRDSNVRLHFTLPKKTTRWRAHFANIDLRQQIAYSDITLTGGWVGQHDISLAFGGRQPTYKFVPGTSAQDIAGATITSGTEYVSSWVTATGRQFNAFTPYLLSFGYTCAASQENVYQLARGSIVAGASHANEDAPTTIPAAVSNTPLAVWIEYEFDGSEQVGLYLGDSLSDGFASANGYLGQWPHLAAQRMGGVAVNASMSGAQAYHWSGGSTTDLKHSRLTSLNIDFAVIALGTNDIAFDYGYTLTRERWIAVRDWIADTLGVKRIYGATVMPNPATHNTTQRRTDRKSFNDWLRNNNANLAGIIDFADLVKSPGNGDKIDARYDNDHTHLTQVGYQKMAALGATTIAPIGVEGRA